MSATAAAERRLRALLRASSGAARAGAAATALLTRVPLPQRMTLAPADLARGAAAFPLVGAAVGALTGAVAAVVATVHGPPLLAGAAGALAAVVATGALHLDGLADSADALGGPTRTDALRIMRDHTLGTYGTTALILDLLLKAVALGALAAQHQAILPAVAAAALARTAAAVTAATTAYAREPGSVAAAFSDAARPAPAAAAALLAAAVAAACALLGAGLAPTLAQATVLTATALLVRRTAIRRIGGITGDVLGAVAETAETAALVTAALALG